MTRQIAFLLALEVMIIAGFLVVASGILSPAPVDPVKGHVEAITDGVARATFLDIEPRGGGIVAPDGEPREGD